MSFSEHAVLWLHVTAVVFTIGPGTAAIMSTPRYIRKKNAVVVNYLLRTTRVYSAAALLVLVFGLILTGMEHKFSQWWISVSLTLFVVAAVLLVLIMRDQRHAVAALTQADEAAALVGATAVRSSETLEEGAEAAAAEEGQPPATGADLKIATVESGRIISMGGVTALIWLVILVLMAWQA
jgi:hypothetical protein